MAEKDIGGRSLLACADVFADIVNVKLFEGVKEVKAEELEDAIARRSTSIAGEKHEQERDAAKYWVRGEIRQALFGLENQVAVYRDMVPKVGGYDGADYKKQELDHVYAHRKREEVPKPYPVITIVLYYGMRRWSGPQTLREYLEGYVHEKLAEYLPEYKLHIMSIAELSEETVKQFKSDFRFIAEYFTQAKRGEDYRPSQKEMDHPEETLYLLSVLADDTRYYNGEIREYMAEKLERKEGVKMSEVLDRMIMRGQEKNIEAALEQGREEGREEGREDKRRIFHKMIEQFKVTQEEAAQVIGMPLSELLGGA